MIPSSLHAFPAKTDREARADAEDAPAKALLKDIEDLRDEFHRAARCHIHIL